MATKAHIALAGNPNCGKTTLFNSLTGSNGYVGNWPGVTVEKKEATWVKDKEVIFTDLPGIYSLSPYSPEEVVSRDYLIDGDAQAVIDLIDVTNLERNLYLATQVLECGAPVVIGLNMCDLLEKSGDKIDVDALSAKLGVDVVKVSALHGDNVDDLVATAVRLSSGTTPAKPAVTFSKAVEDALAVIADGIKDQVPQNLLRWYSIKVFERDAEAIKPIGLTQDEIAAFEPAIEAVEKSLDDDSESIITGERYDWIGDVVEAAVVKAPPVKTTTEKIDSIVTNRWLGLPIFVAVMVLVYFLAVSTVGTWGTDWANDGVFGDGWWLFGIGSAEYDAASEEAGFAGDNFQNYDAKIAAYLEQADAQGVDAKDASAAVESEEFDSEAITTFQKNASSAGVVALAPAMDADGNLLDAKGEAVPMTVTKDGETKAANPDDVDLQVVNASDFSAAITAKANQPQPTSFGIWVPGVPVIVGGWLDAIGTSDLVRSLIIDGIVGGVGSILGFLPQMFVLFVMLCFLEDCGYMSRVAFVMDRVFRRFGLSGKSFIPMLISSGCGVPGVMATKTIENRSDRRMTAMVTTFVPCGAKLPIISMLMGALIGGTEHWWIAPLFYFMGIAAVIISGIMLKKTKPFAGEPSPFVMELPAYHMPALKSWFLHVWERCSAFVKKAGTIILASSVLIWFLSNFGTYEGTFGYLPDVAADVEDFQSLSLLAAVGGALGFLFAPLGWSSWQAVASTFSGLIAKENLVSTYGVLFGIGEVGESSTALWAAFTSMFVDGAGIVHVSAMFSLVAFNLLCAPCFAAMGAIRRQMDNDTKWWLAALGYECGFAWVIALIIFNIGELIAFGTFTVWTGVAFVALALMLFQLFRPMPHYDDKDDKILTTLEEDSSEA